MLETLKYIMIGLMIGLLTVNTQIVASASSVEEIQMIDEISQATGLSNQEIENDIELVQELLDLTREEAIEKLYEEVVLQYLEDVDNLEISGRSSSSSGTKKYLPTTSGSGAIRGNIFYTPSKTSGWNHGHAGLYASASTIVHAPGRGSEVRTDRAGKLEADSGSKIAQPNSTSKRGSAATYAEKRIGAPYLTSTVNMSCPKAANYKTDKVNCSQLVYCAYKHAGVDVSNGSTIFVSPKDVVNNKNVTTVWSRK